ncbi:MAG: heparinase II/III domain-containing protein [Alkalispirochaetaceae bacterium]
MRPLYLLHTLRHLTLRQLAYRMIRAVQKPMRRLSGPRSATSLRPGDARTLSLRPLPETDNYITDKEIVLLGSPYPIASPGAVDYTAPENDSLYRYLLSGQSFLLGEKSEPGAVRAALISAARGMLSLPTATDRGSRSQRAHRPLMEPHPLSLRLITWVRLLSVPNAGPGQDPGSRTPAFQFEERVLVSEAIQFQLRALLRQIEYETDGNHLIDNAVGLMYGGAYLSDRRALLRGWELLRQELPKQLTHTRAHIEGSGVYHALMLERVLDVINLLGNEEIGRFLGAAQAVTALTCRARAMLSWALHTRWGEEESLPVNDSLPGLAPDLRDLEVYAWYLGVTPDLRAREATQGAGTAARRPEADHSSAARPRYHFYRDDRLELFFDAAPIGAEHVPGHAHSDSLQLLLRLDRRDILVDTGTSVYEGGETRCRERSTGAHNTVAYGGKEQNEVWSSFRVARRARPRGLGREAFPAPAEGGAWAWLFGAEHDGYRRYGVVHRRGLWVAPPANAGDEQSESIAIEGPGERRSSPALHGASSARSGILIRDELLGSARRGSRLAERNGVWGLAYFILAPQLAREIGSLERVPAAPSTEGSSTVVPSLATFGAGEPTPKGWQLSAGPVTFTFISRPGAPTSGVVGLPRPQLERWLVAAGYRKQVETVRIAVPFFTLLETRIDER